MKTKALKTVGKAGKAGNKALDLLSLPGAVTEISRYLQSREVRKTDPGRNERKAREAKIKAVRFAFEQGSITPSQYLQVILSL